MTEPVAPELAILDVPMDPNGNGVGAETIGQHLADLLLALWDKGSDFSGKRPFGDSGWQWDVYTALGHGGIIEVTFDDDGFIQEMADEECAKADELIRGAVVLSLRRDPS